LVSWGGFGVSSHPPPHRGGHDVARGGGQKTFVWALFRQDGAGGLFGGWSTVFAGGESFKIGSNPPPPPPLLQHPPMFFQFFLGGLVLGLSELRGGANINFWVFPSPEGGLFKSLFPPTPLFSWSLSVETFLLPLPGWDTKYRWGPGGLDGGGGGGWGGWVGGGKQWVTLSPRTGWQPVGGLPSWMGGGPPPPLVFFVGGHLCYCFRVKSVVGGNLCVFTPASGPSPLAILGWDSRSGQKELPPVPRNADLGRMPNPERGLWSVPVYKSVLGWFPWVHGRSLHGMEIGSSCTYTSSDPLGVYKPRFSARHLHSCF